LFLGDRVGPINEIAPYIKAGAYKTVEQRTGIKFGEGFLKNILGEGSMYLNSLPAAIALCIVKEQKPTLPFDFAGTLLKAVYYDGLHPTNLEGITKYAQKIGFDKEEFIQKLSEAKYLTLAKKEFELFGASGFSGMPGVSIAKDGKEEILSSGYVSYGVLEQKIEHFLRKNK